MTLPSEEHETPRLSLLIIVRAVALTVAVVVMTALVSSAKHKPYHVSEAAGSPEQGTAN
jgi:hypothetical protein